MAQQALEHGGADAIVCASDVLALGAHLAAMDTGKPATPIYGFDNTPTAGALGISSVEQKPERVAAGILDILAHYPPDDADYAYLLITPELVVR